MADPWGGNTRVQVFDKHGAYLTTVDGSYGIRNGQNRGPRGLAIDRAGNLYMADWDNARVKKYARGVPGWSQINLNGFGDVSNIAVMSFAELNGAVYAGAYNRSVAGAQVLRQALDGGWTVVVADGFGDSGNISVDDLARFNGQLYAGTWNWVCDDPNCYSGHSNGGQIWRSPNGQSWSQVVSDGFGDADNGEITRFAVFNGSIYAGTSSYASQHGGEIWRSSTGNSNDWTRVAVNGFGSADNWAVTSLGEHNGHLFAGTYNYITGGEVWRTPDGVTWQQVNVDGFGDNANYVVTALESFQSYLYAATAHRSGAGFEVWRCQLCTGSDWTQVVDNGFGNPDTRYNVALEVFENRLHAVASNYVTGMEIWESGDGATWRQIGFADFGDSNNFSINNAVAVINDSLFVGTGNSANGGEVWQRLHRSLYLPLLVRRQ